MKKIFVRSFCAVLAALTLIGSLSACRSGGASQGGTVGQGSISFAKAYRSDIGDPLVPSYTEATAVQGLNGRRIVDGTRMLLLYDEKAKEYCYFDPVKERDVLTVSASRLASVEDIKCYLDFLWVVETDGDQKSTSVYGIDGTHYVTVPKQANIVAVETGFALDGKFYAVKDGAVSNVYTLPPLMDVSSLTFTENYAYKYSDSLRFYNQKLEMVWSYVFPELATNIRLFRVGDDGLLAEYRLPCSPDSKDYDYYTGGNKYKFCHVFFDPAERRARDLKLDGWLVDVYREGDTVSRDLKLEDVFTDKVPNVLVYRSFIDGQVGETEHYTVLKDNGNFGAALDGFVKGQKGLILPFADGQYSVKTDTGYAVLDAEGKVLYTFDSEISAKEFGYLVSGIDIYDHEFNLIAEMQRSPIGNTDVALFYSEYADLTDWHRYDKNGKAQIEAPAGHQLSYDPVSVESRYYILTSRSTSTYSLRYDVYSLYGEPLVTDIETIDGQYEKDGVLVLVYTAKGDSTRKCVRLS